MHILGFDEIEVDCGEDDDLYPNVDQIVSPSDSIESDRIYPLVLENSQRRSCIGELWSSQMLEIWLRLWCRYPCPWSANGKAESQGRKGWARL